MEQAHPYQKYYGDTYPALKSKQEEFELLGYPDVTEKDIWGYLTNKRWKKVHEDARISVLIQDIMRVKVQEYMNYVTIEAMRYGDSNKMTAASLDEYKDLFS